ncbi:hypothetical protein T10_10129 [Trichinella papuae]|uniref:Uncharacterized protein n=1 Tax=Trichinella papuae TaxID=268474 RepID=A0A0V1N1Y8_9BILA|nr:hypothetical protein T10_10129 [Trichinella papuae]
MQSTEHRRITNHRMTTWSTAMLSITVNEDYHDWESLQQQFCLACKPSCTRQWNTFCLKKAKVNLRRSYIQCSQVPAQTVQGNRKGGITVKKELPIRLHLTMEKQSGCPAQKISATLARNSPIRNNRAHSSPDVQREGHKEPVQKMSCTL